MESYGIEFKMKDLVSSPFAKMVNNVGSGFDKMEARMKRFESGFGTMANRINRLNQSLSGFDSRRTIRLDARQLQLAENQLNRLNRQLNRLARTQRINNPVAPQTNGFNAPQGGGGANGFVRGGLLSMANNPYVTAGLAGIVAIKKAADIGGQLSEKGYEYERNRFGITQYTGNQATSEKYIDKMSKTSTGKMFGSDAVAGFQQAIMGFQNAEKSFEFVTKRLSNISAGSGVSIADLAGIQMKTRMQGYVQMDEASQYSERKIPLLQYLEKATKLNSSQLLKAIEKRQIKTESFDKALELMTTGKGIFSGMTDKAMNAGFGQKLAFNNGSDMMMQKAGNKVNELFTNRFYKAGNSFLDALEKKEPQIKSAFDRLAVQLELTNTPLKGFGSNVNAASLVAGGFAKTLSGIAGTFEWFSKKNDEKTTEVNKDILYLTQKEEIKKIEAKRPSKKFFGSDAENEKYRLDNLSIDNEVKVAERRHLEQSLKFKDAQEQKRLLGIQMMRKNTLEGKVRDQRALRHGVNKDGSEKNTGGGNTSTVGTGLNSSSATGGGVKNITLNISSLINQVQMIKENGKGLDTDQVKRILHEELTATIASAVMMGSGN